MNKRLLLLFNVTALLIISCNFNNHSDAPELSSEFWKQQTINKIIEPWTKRGGNSGDRRIPAFMDRNWKPGQTDHIYPGMYSRHIFSYSAAYLMTGKQKYIDIASKLVDYLITYGWDKEYGLWYNEIDTFGEPIDVQKDMFMQLYAVTGLTMYYAVTRDVEVDRYIQNSLDLLKDHAWDHTYEGYINGLKRDLSVSDDSKRTTPQVAPISGYLAYLYPISRKQEYLLMQERGLEIIGNHMINFEEGWLLDNYNRQWKREEDRHFRVNVGHNLEWVWLLLRLNLLTDDEQLRREAFEHYEQLVDTAFHSDTGAWQHWIDPKREDDEQKHSTWWVQAYGNMNELYLYHITDDPIHLERFVKGSRFWNNYFIDHELGGTYMSVGLNGELRRGDKATRSKTSYHAVEHGLLNYLYLGFWVEERPITLYYYIASAEEGDNFYPHIIEDLNLSVDSVKINGKKWDRFNVSEGTIELPDVEQAKVEVTMSS